METVNVLGASGASYTYYSYLKGDSWNDVPINYMFARRDIGSWFVPYVGETDSAKNRIPCHERWDEAVRVHRVTHVLAHVNHGGIDARQREERDLIQALCPPMNVQHQRAYPLARGLLG